MEQLYTKLVGIGRGGTSTCLTTMVRFIDDLRLELPTNGIRGEIGTHTKQLRKTIYPNSATIYCFLSLRLIFFSLINSLSAAMIKLLIENVSLGL